MTILINEYKKKMDSVKLSDPEGKGFFYDTKQAIWHCYSYDICSYLLNSDYVIKEKLSIPLEIFSASDKSRVARFIFYLNNSLIFNDDKHNNDAVSFIRGKFNEIDFEIIANDLLSSLKESDVITEEHLRGVNNLLAASLVGLKASAFFSAHALNVGMFFDGKVRGKAHFVSIAESFIAIYQQILRQMTINGEVMELIHVEKFVADLSVTFIAAHETTMQLIAATLFYIKNNAITVTENNIKSIVIETYRISSPVLSVDRVFKERLIYKNSCFNKGDRALLYTGLANFDAAVFDHPYQFQPDREGCPLSFGAGAKKCIGMNIAIHFTCQLITKILSCYQLDDVEIYEVIVDSSAIGCSKFTLSVSKKLKVSF
ncbi:cytochrome P450 [Photorhabdus sp. APURE]|uniref:cytochrome P450 n=1 Tax=Photorhabdus aballayi TaxID=2991723 RepID=UPI00223CDB8E|nr:cytochrome P450 [Photorhabdus aballayi]MCW7549648.1 cytochrome P450 [Photorhabdus aballayi]